MRENNYIRSFIEKRNEIRLSGKQIPDYCRVFPIVLLNEREIYVELLNFSINGISFITHYHQDYFTIGKEIASYALNCGHPVFGKVIYTKKHNKMIQVGIRYNHGRAYEDYRKIFNTLYEEISKKND